MRGLGRRRISDGPRGGGPRSGTAAAPVGSTRPSDPMRIGRRSFIRRAVPRVMVALTPTDFCNDFYRDPAGWPALLLL